MAVAGQAPGDGSVRLDGVEIEGARVDFELAAGEQLVTLADGGSERLLAMVLKRHISRNAGWSPSAARTWRPSICRCCASK